MSGVTIDKGAFRRRLLAIHSSWVTGRSATPEPSVHWEEADAIAVIEGSAQEDSVEGRTFQLMMYLLGYEFTDTLMVLTQSKLIVVTSSKKLKLLETLKGGGDSAPNPVELVLL